MTVVQQDGDRAVGPSSADDNVEKGVAVYIARGDLKSTGGSGDTDTLARTAAHLEADPVTRI